MPTRKTSPRAEGKAGKAGLVSGRCKGQDGNISGPFDGDRHLPLVFCAVSGNPSWDDLSSLCNEISKDPRVLIVDVQLLVGTESADLPSEERSLLSVGSWSLTWSIHHLLLFVVKLSYRLPPPTFEGL